MAEAFAGNHKNPGENGPKRSPQRGLCPARTAPPKEAGLTALLHLPKHGMGPYLPHQCDGVCHPGSQPPNPSISEAVSDLSVGKSSSAEADKGFATFANVSRKFGIRSFDNPSDG